MTKDQIFDEEISVRYATATGEALTSCSNTMTERKVMLRITANDQKKGI